MPVKEVEVHAVASDTEFAANEGKFFDVGPKTRIFNEDVDVYAINTEADVAAGKPKRKLLAKFRKAVLPKPTVQQGWDAFRLLAIPSRNRGAAAGPVDAALAAGGMDEVAGVEVRVAAALLAGGGGRAGGDVAALSGAARLARRCWPPAPAPPRRRPPRRRPPPLRRRTTTPPSNR